MDAEPGAEFAGRRVALAGLGRSNAAVARVLGARGARLEAYDQRPGAGGLGPDVALHAGPGYLDALAARLEGLAAIFVTPGMRKDLPVLVAARQAGVALWTEAAYALAVAPRPVIGITGSAGKTTTTTLVGGAVARWRPGSIVGGNIGIPLLDRLAGLPPAAWIVMELSSFQLELATVAPTVAGLLNISPNHLDLHGSYAAYVAAKRRIFEAQRPGDWAVFGSDDASASALAGRAPAGRIAFSARGPVAAGVGVEGGTLVWVPPSPDGAGRGPAVPHPRAAGVLPVSAIRVPGWHNVENVAAAAALALVAGAPPRAVAATVRAFRGVEHRLQVVRRWGGATWINDSIATAPDRTAAALATFAGRRIVLLAGGYDKGLDFDDLGVQIAGATEHVILFGRTAPRIARAVAVAAGESGRGPEVSAVPDLAAAVALAAEGVRPGQVVLLSPACASFDQFRDFEARGQAFCQHVAALGRPRTRTGAAGRQGRPGAGANAAPVGGDGRGPGGPGVS